ncbi:DUF4868 domain-containing protein [Arthrobacter sp. TPD3018]|uniref:Kiwa anti-phage protein KwaB-like domain-containing protein n=1 Tax=Bacteria TaxID=2 RepID=UPI000D513EAC|nr:MULTISPECIES: Kiwa anti-phage protein KwaB-like domain-containing protein [Bacteria]PVE52690.1 DUF4868 domain-containing protein [Sphingomonas sp. TPD3009]PVE52874.1 DUF4868 domain-containing protein [Arthrobacter sp. TPD3018]PVE81262.1 DUF4868 domain-containing protein [Sphingomonas melonis]
MANLAGLKAFDFAGADLTVWVYKRSTRDGVPVFTGRWVGITDELAASLREAVAQRIDAVGETIEYEILAQNNEASVLTLGADETHIALVEAQSANPTEARKVKRLKQIANAHFYMLRFATQDDVLLAVRKTNASWSTRRATDMLRVVFQDEELDVDERPTFTMEPVFDFFVFDGDVFVANKARFESVLAYRAGHMEAFQELAGEPDFSGIFSDVAAITAFVGENKIQLRRAVAIREKGHFRDPAFMQNLRTECEAMGLAIVFDDAGLIVPSPETCRDIFQALLDHRLDSRLSMRLYDVQSTEAVQ